MTLASRAAACGLLLSLVACTYYGVPAGQAVPASYERSFAAVAAAMRDQGLAISVEDRASGTVVGSSDAGSVTATVRPQPDGSVRAQFDARGARDPQLIERVSQSYDRRMGRW